MAPKAKASPSKKAAKGEKPAKKEKKEKARCLSLLITAVGRVGGPAGGQLPGGAGGALCQR